MATILITGASGFVGRNLLTELAPRHEIVALSRVPLVNPGPGVAVVEHDLTRPLDYAKLPAHIDAVIHLAQSKHYKQFPERAQDIFDVNVRGTFDLLEYARHAGAESFVFTSSGGVYGYSYERFVETDPVSPLNFYLSSKYAAELFLANYTHIFRTVVLRLFFVYGPGQSGMLIPSLLERVRQGEAVRIEGNPGIRINPIHVADVVKVFEPALGLQQSELLNVAGEEAVTLTELVQHMGRVTGQAPMLSYGPAGAGGDLLGDNSHLKRILALTPRVSLEEGLASMLQPMRPGG